jgi:hypothetical protein
VLLTLKVVYIRAENGRVVETNVVEDEIENVVKGAAKEALEEWDPKVSEFVVLKDEEEVTIKLPIPEDLANELKRFGFKKKNKEEAIIRYPYYTISFDNRKVNEDYVEYKIILIAPYINDDFTAWLETLAAEIVSEKEVPEGIEEL